eukprot:g41793.t1
MPAQLPPLPMGVRGYIQETQFHGRAPGYTAVMPHGPMGPGTYISPPGYAVQLQPYTTLVPVYSIGNANGLLAPEVEYEMLLLQFAVGVIATLEEAQGVGEGIKMVGNWKVAEVAENDALDAEVGGVICEDQGDISALFIQLYFPNVIAQDGNS